MPVGRRTDVEGIVLLLKGLQAERDDTLSPCVHDVWESERVTHDPNADMVLGTLHEESERLMCVCGRFVCGCDCVWDHSRLLATSPRAARASGE